MPAESNISDAFAPLLPLDITSVIIYRKKSTDDKSIWRVCLDVLHKIFCRSSAYPSERFKIDHNRYSNKRRDI